MPAFGPPHHRPDREERQAETTADVQERSRGTTATGENPTLFRAAVGTPTRNGGSSATAASPDRVARGRGFMSSCIPGPGSPALFHGSGQRMNQLTDRLRFLRAFAANPRQVGAILPTSRQAVRVMLDM